MAIPNLAEGQNIASNLPPATDITTNNSDRNKLVENDQVASLGPTLGV
jgi:hypothetical protein